MRIPRMLVLFLALTLAPWSLAPARASDEEANAGEEPGAKSEEERRERMMAAWDEIVETFTGDPDAAISAAKIDADIAARLDADEDGTITGDEYRDYRKRMSRPRDRSDFTHIEEGGFPLNLDPEIVPAGEAGLDDDDIVMGVVIGDEARAYPVNYMNGPYNEVVNDTLGGTPIAPSW